MICPECGKETNDNDIFCGNCGAEIINIDIPVQTDETASRSKKSRRSSKNQNADKMKSFKLAAKIIAAVIVVAVIIIVIV
ncbi:MAG: zinc ribbon domain-containing protein, partial [Oscillospiraceae bacterium]|nr:zinc ribbon domain-containing protein [Oscillospiraceae bacterium]